MITPTCGKAMYTALATGNAAGEYMPPLVVYKAQYLNDSWTINGPKDATYAVTEWLDVRCHFGTVVSKFIHTTSFIYNKASHYFFLWTWVSSYCCLV